MLGHADLKSTEIYTQVSIKALKAVHTATHPARPIRSRPTIRSDAARSDAARSDVGDDAPEDAGALLALLEAEADAEEVGGQP